MVSGLTINPCDSVENLGWLQWNNKSQEFKIILLDTQTVQSKPLLSKVQEYQESLFRFLLFLWELLQHYEYKASPFLKELSPHAGAKLSSKSWVARWRNKALTFLWCKVEYVNSSKSVFLNLPWKKYKLKDQVVSD